MVAANERVFAAQPVGYGGQKVIASPFQFATTDDDNLQIVSANSLVGVVLAVQGRRVNTAGLIEPFAFTHTPNSDRSSKTENFKLGAGALLNLTIFAITGSPMIGQTYVSARLIRGLSAATILLGGLLGGYVTAAQPISYPGSPIASSLEGEPLIRVIDGTTPLAAHELAETVPTGARWDLLTFKAVFTASATPANRTADLNFVVNSVPILNNVPAKFMVAGEIWTLSWAPGLGTIVDPAFFRQNIALPTRSILPAGSVITSDTGAMQVGDQWSSVRYSVREWLEVSA